jgi:uncharacterized membrane protein YqjE
MTEPEAKPPEAPSGFLSSVAHLFGTLVEMAYTRLELFLVDLEQEVTGFMAVALWSLGALLAAAAGLFIGALALIFAFWDTHRVLVSVLLMVGFLTLAAAAALVVVAKQRARRSFFAVTLSQFAKDRAMLKVRS